MPLHLVCCVKQVVDPETPISAFRVDEVAGRVLPAPGIPLVMSQFDQVAVEAALRLREASGEGTITIISLGPDSARDAIKTALAMGADEGILLSDPLFLDGDAFATAVALKAAIDKIGVVDLVFCGRQATDWDQGVTGLVLAELMGVPSVHIAKSVSYTGGKVRAERMLDDAIEQIEVPAPAVVTVSGELGQPRYPKLSQIMQAARKQITVWTAADLGLGAGQVGAMGSRLELQALSVPRVQRQVEFIEGEDEVQIARKLADTLHAAKLI